MQPINQQIQRFLQSTWPPKAASALILILFSWWTFANILPFFEEKEIDSAPQLIKRTKAPEQFSLKNLDLFGKSEKSKAVNKTSEAKQTKLNLTLRGVLATDDPKQGIAQIQNAKKLERHFVVNDSVFGQATLEEIYMDRVIILHNGRYETLLLPEKFLNVKHFSAENEKLERKKLATDYRDLFLRRKTSDLIKLFGFDTAWKNGGFQGFIVKALGDKGREIMEKFGVQDGDLITVVNGLRFSETLEASQQLLELKTATSVEGIIERDGLEIPFHVDFEAPLSEVTEVSGGANSNQYGSPNYKNNLETPSTKKPIDKSINWKDSPRAEEYRRKQRERTTGVREEVEYDH